MALSGMFRLGEIYAGHQIAQSLFYNLIDKQLALEVIEMTFEQYRQRRAQRPVFTHGDSETDPLSQLQHYHGRGYSHETRMQSLRESIIASRDQGNALFNRLKQVIHQ